MTEDNLLHGRISFKLFSLSRSKLSQIHTSTSATELKGSWKGTTRYPQFRDTHLNYVNLLLGNGLSLFSLIYYHHPRDFTDTQRDCVWSLSVRAFPYNWEALEQTTHGRHLRSPLCERTPRNWSRESGSHGERRYLDIGYRSSSLHGFDRTALEGETRITLLWENVQ